MLKIKVSDTYLLDASIVLASVSSAIFLTVNPVFSQVNPTVRTYKLPGGNIIKVTVPNYSISDSPGGTRVRTPVGSVRNNLGFKEKPNNALKSSAGTVITSDGLIFSRDGREIITPAGRVYSSEGFYVSPDGSYITPAGTMIKPNGTIIKRNSTVPF